MAEHGKYIVIEGNDGTGKSTQVEKIRARLAERDIESVDYHEPAGTPIADEIRTILKNGKLERDAETELLLFTAARHEIWRRAEKELALGRWVVSARNHFSTLTYQGYAGGLDLDLIRHTTQSFTSFRYMYPDLTVILTLDEESRKKRIEERGPTENPDAFELRDEEFQKALNDGYLKIAQQYKIKPLDASQSIDDVTEEIWQQVEPLL